MTDAQEAYETDDQTINAAPDSNTASFSAKKEFARRVAAHCTAYMGAQPKRALAQLFITLALFAANVAAMFATVETAYWLTLLLAIPAGGLLVRLFIIQHDCGHGSFFATRTLNDLLGHALSVLTITPYQIWRREHARHHATSGDLDRRGVGDITTLTVAEYQARSPFGRFLYQIYRNPIFLFGLGVPLFFLVLQRLPWGHGVPVRQAWKNVLGLNAALIIFYGGLIAAFGLSSTVFVAWPILHLATAIGGWLFFIQHQFEEAHWERNEDWDFQVAAIYGSSYYALPGPLEWLTGYIGLHHIHHLNSMIPNYRLAECLAASPELSELNRLSLWDSFACAGLKLWDEDRQRLVNFSAVG